MQEVLVDFITSLDGYGAGEGWPGWWGLEGPEYLAWLDRQPERDYTILMGANTYRLMSGFATESKASASEEPMTDEGAAIAELARMSKVVFSSTLQAPLSWPNTRLISGDAVEAVAAMKRDGTSPMSPSTWLPAERSTGDSSCLSMSLRAYRSTRHAPRFLSACYRAAPRRLAAGRL